ncbi:MAG: phosphoserine phosphatase SerB [Ostreibacterium sp.]
MGAVNTSSVKSLTLVAQHRLTKTLLSKVLAPLVKIQALHQRHEHVWEIICHEKTKITADLRTLFYQQGWDFALQNLNRCKKKLFLSDMDATLVEGETIDEMATALGIYPEISAITQAAMNGEIDYQESLKQRLALLKGIPYKTIMDIAHQIKLTQGADNLLSGINRLGMDSCLISGGFSTFTEIVSQKLGFKQYLSNVLSYDNNNRLDGRWVGDLVTAEVKEETLKRLAKQNNLSLSETVAIGDGANDIGMVKAAGLGISFYGKPAMRAVAQAEIHSGKIDTVLWFL